MSNSELSIGQQVLSSIDEVREHLTDQEKMLIDSFLQAHAALHNAAQFIKLGKHTLAEMVCDTGSDQRLAYLQAFLDSKKKKEA